MVEVADDTLPVVQRPAVVQPVSRRGLLVVGDVSEGDPRFHALLKEIGDLHDVKQADYGTDHDPFANVRGSVDWGVEPWRGGLVRLGDKVTRLKQYARTGTLANEGVEDTLKDLAVYALITLILWREEHEEKDVDVVQAPDEVRTRNQFEKWIAEKFTGAR